MKGMTTQNDINDSLKSLFSQGKGKSSNPNSLLSKPLKNNTINENKSEPQFRMQSKSKPKSDRPPRPVKITEKTQRSLQWIILAILFGTLGYAFLTLNFTDINSVFASKGLMPVVLGFIVVFFLWQFTSDQLSQFPLEIVEGRPRRQRHKRKTPNPAPVSTSGASVLDLQTKMYGGAPPPTPPTTISQSQYESRTFDKTSLMIITIGIIFVFMLCIWAIDMSVTALRLESAGYIAKLDNGWMLQNPALIYHLALYTMILLVAVLVMIAMLNLIRRTDIPWLPLLKAKPKPQTVPLSSGKSVLFSMVGYTVSMAFTVMVMVFLAVSWTGTKGLTIIHWNHFGEHNIETLIFIIAFVLILIGFYFTFKNFRETVITRRLNR